MYTYDVDATGSPAPTYDLLTKPTGMTISTTTGLIQWTPAAAGSAFVEVEAVNGEGSDTQPYWIVVTDPVVPGVENVAVTSTSGNDLTTDDLTCGYDLTGDAVTASTAWYAGGPLLDPLMTLYLPMEGGMANALNDYSGNGIVSVAHGNPVWSATGGHDGHGAWVFDGDGDDLSAGENFPLSASYTKTAWVYRTGSGANGGNNIISGDANTGGHAFWAPDMWGNKLSAGHNYAWDQVQDDVALATDTWYFVALSFEYVTGELILYKNGAPVDTALLSGADLDVTDATISIGSFGVSNGWMWQGTIDDARIYNRALSPDQILALYNGESNVIRSTETLDGDAWMACVTPFSLTDAGTTVCSDTLFVEADGTGIEERVIPAQLALHQNVPNPFNPTTVINYDLHIGGRVSLRVYDVKGRLVKTLVTDTKNAGRQTVTWDGTDNAGDRVGSGVYFYRLNAEGRVLTRKMVLLK
ncbi:MAG: FlgD immunoglobulin-like domain containing protein [bacterium]